ncbi:MAG: Rrf2 family transcriptional regulator [Nitrospiraceae bacterium]|nr:MAG: Rrf2 family transcriptional regulator [Nitrospiraceae bacterium]
MQITRETDYAIRCVLYLVENPGKVIMVDSIAQDKDIPKSFLSKILQKLTRADIVSSFRGMKGGFKLSKNPDQISLLTVIEAIEGPVTINRCALDENICSLSNSCTVHPVWVALRGKLESWLSQQTFEGLTAKDK